MKAQTDSRFTISREYCGEKRAKWILRFCGDWVSKHDSQAKARQTRMAAILARKTRLGTP